MVEMTYVNNGYITSKLASIISKINIDNVDVEAIDRARVAIVDSIGVGLAGYTLSSLPTSITRYITLDNGKATLFDLKRRGKQLLVAFINSVATHAIEFDDWIPEGYVHPGCVIIPSALSIGEETSSRWIDVLEAVITGYEVIARVGAFLGRKHYEKFHTTGTAGVFGAVATASKLLNLDYKEIVYSLGIAGSFVSGLWEFIKVGSSIKPLSPAYAVLKGILSTYLALEGCRGPESVFEGDAGILKSLYSDGIMKYIDRPAWKYAILRDNFKPFPTCRHTHSAIEAAVKLRRVIGSLDEIDKVIVEVYDEAAKIAGLIKPIDLDEARFSLPYCVSTALLYGRLGYEELVRGLGDERIVELQDRIEVVVNNKYSAMYPEMQYSRITILMNNGDMYSEVVKAPMGSIEKPFTLDNVVEKIGYLVRYAKISFNIQSLIEYLTNKLDEEVDLMKLKD